ncbi:MAG: tRNA lysidine(34) synthetase TilS, partial [Endozoicomonas sp.]
QEYRVPPWLRDYIPLVFDGERMIAAAGLWVCDGYRVIAPDCQSIEWCQEPDRGYPKNINIQRA